MTPKEKALAEYNRQYGLRSPDQAFNAGWEACYDHLRPLTEPIVDPRNSEEPEFKVDKPKESS